MSITQDQVKALDDKSNTQKRGRGRPRKNNTTPVIKTSEKLMKKKVEEIGDAVYKKEEEKKKVEAKMKYENYKKYFSHIVKDLNSNASYVQYEAELKRIKSALGTTSNFTLDGVKYMINGAMHIVHGFLESYKQDKLTILSRNLLINYHNDDTIFDDELKEILAEIETMVYFSPWSRLLVKVVKSAVIPPVMINNKPSEKKEENVTPEEAAKKYKK